jgi:ubiquinone/menaquinone biosynthesis C-methylase UbiE
MGEPLPGQTTFDHGCGAGFDTLLAAQRLGTSGNAIGVDMTHKMIGKARTNAETLGLMNVEFLLGEIEALPIADSSVDLVVSNGVFNLCPDKQRALSEVFRILKRGGRLQLADILLEPHVTPKEVARKVLIVAAYCHYESVVSHRQPQKRAKKLHGYEPISWECLQTF